LHCDSIFAQLTQKQLESAVCWSETVDLNVSKFGAAAGMTFLIQPSLTQASSDQITDDAPDARRWKLSVAVHVLAS
jgi:hypothetical protein